MTFTCAACGITTDYKPEWESDFPDGWFGLENRDWSAPLCSAKCVRAYLEIVAGGAQAPAQPETGQASK